MNKTQLIEAIATKAGGTKQQATAFLNEFVETVIETVANGEKVAIAGFGTFEPRHRQQRRTMNPKTKELMTVPATVVPAFQPGSGFRQQVSNQEDLAAVS